MEDKFFIKHTSLLTVCLLIADEAYTVFPTNIGNYVRVIFYILSFYLILKA